MDSLAQNIMILLTILLPIYVAGYGNGAVQAACYSMFPGHNVAVQSSSAPYSLALSKNTYGVGEKITVTLTSTSADSPIEGFMIQAREDNNTTPLGSFMVQGSDSQTLNCNTTASAVSHTSEDKKTKVQVTWVAPRANISNIQLRATVVKNETTFWMNVVSPKLTYSAGSQLLVPALSQLLLSTVLIFVFLKR